MYARCRIDSPLWGENGMTDEQVACFYESLDYCEKNVHNFNKMNILEQEAEIIMHMIRIKDRPRKQEFIEQVKRIDELIRIEKAQKELFKQLGREDIL